MGLNIAQVSCRAQACFSLWSAKRDWGFKGTWGTWRQHWSAALERGPGEVHSHILNVSLPLSSAVLKSSERKSFELLLRGCPGGSPPSHANVNFVTWQDPGLHQKCVCSWLMFFIKRGPYSAYAHIHIYIYTCAYTYTYTHTHSHTHMCTYI